MGTILIKADSKSYKILLELAKVLGTNFVSLRDEQFEDFVLGNIMDKVKSGENVDRGIVMKKLNSK